MRAIVHSPYRADNSGYDFFLKIWVASDEGWQLKYKTVEVLSHICFGTTNFQ